MKSELNFLTKEAEARDDQIQTFLSAFIPEFRSKRREKPEENFKLPKSWEEKALSGPSTPPVSPVLGDPFVDLKIEHKDENGKLLPLPKVSYAWKEPLHKGSRMPVYLPRSGYTLTSGVFQREDELHLTMKFENESSRDLPSKIQLEIRDSSGNLVYTKRQNIYYVKLQEKLGTLDSAKDYVMTVTSITGQHKSSEEVTIRNKNFDSSKEKGTFFPPNGTTDRQTILYHITIFFLDERYQVINSMILPELATALEEFSEEVKCLEETTNLDERCDLDSLAQTVEPVCLNFEDTELAKATKISNIVLKRDPDRPLKTPTPTPTSPTRKNALVMHKKLILPVKTRYRWQKGFRKINGSYVKIPLVKLEVDYGKDVEFIPPEISFRLFLDTNNNNDRDIGEKEVVIKTSVNRSNIYSCEMTMHDLKDQEVIRKVINSDRLRIEVRESETEGSKSCLLTRFQILLDNLKKEEVQLNQWCATDPTILSNDLARIF